MENYKMNEMLWVEKYRPKTVAQTILPQRLKTTFQSFVNNKEIPNLILAGSPGCGKTTVARAMLEEIGCQYLVINGSLDGNIDTLRTKIREFASSMSLDGKRKYVIFDEADYLTPLTQPALRNFMEEYSRWCGFILTCNYKDKIIEAIHSRCSLVEFIYSKEERLETAKEFFESVKNILKLELITFNPKAIILLIKKHRTDFRKVLNEIQRYSATGNIDVGIVYSADENSLRNLIEHIQNKDWSNILKWVGEGDWDSHTIFRNLYDYAIEKLDSEDAPLIVQVLAEAQYRAAFALDKDINLLDCLVNLMTADVKWKK